MIFGEGDKPLDNTCFLVAGALGFIGKALISRVVNLGAVVLPLDFRSPSDTERSCLPSGNPFFVGKIEDRIHDLELAVKKNGDRRLFAVNLGGVASVSKCEAAPAVAYDSNAHFPLLFARVSDSLGAECHVFPSTGYVYGDSHAGLLSEKFPVYPTNVYVSTKLAAERLLELFSTRSKCRVAIIRPSNVYGPGCSVDSVIGTILDQVSNGRPIQVKCQTPLRDFIHIDDLVDAVIALCLNDKLKHFDVLNISTACATSIGELAALVAEIWGRDFSHSKTNEGQLSSLILDSAKARRELGWSPDVSLRRGLERIHGGEIHG